MFETRLRSLIKTIAWRIAGFFITVGYIYSINKNIKSALSLGLGINIFLMIGYYIHERIWDRIKWERSIK